MSDAIDIFEIMQSTRAMRRLRSDPVADELIEQLLEAATCAPNAANQQRWSFLVVRDSSIKRRVQHYYALAQEKMNPKAYGSVPIATTSQQHERQFGEVSYLTEHIHEAPVWIVPCLDMKERTPNIYSGASIYPAVQNILLAARALGLGATLTTRHNLFAAEVNAIFGLPPTAYSCAIIPIGYPAKPFGPVRRAPIGEVTFRDRWGQREWSAVAP